VVPYSICQNINVFLEKRTTRIIQLDRSYFKVMGKLKYILIRLTYDPKVNQAIDIIVVDISKAYGLLLSMD